MNTITLDTGDKIAIRIAGQTVTIQHVAEGDDHAIQLDGVDCALEGELPGLYYLAPLPAQAASS